jgi:hypothetical protein
LSDTVFTHITPRDEVLTSETVLSATGVTDWHRFREGFAVQITGTATSVTANVIRSTLYPGTNTSGQTIDYGQSGCLANSVTYGTAISGNPSNGIITTYIEPGTAWFCVQVTAVTGGNVQISMSGKFGG